MERKVYEEVIWRSIIHTQYPHSAPDMASSQCRTGQSVQDRAVSPGNTDTIHTIDTIPWNNGKEVPR